MSVYGKFSVVISDDERYVKGQSYDVVLATAPDPASVIVAEIPPAPVTSVPDEVTPTEA